MSSIEAFKKFFEILHAHKPNITFPMIQESDFMKSSIDYNDSAHQYVNNFTAVYEFPEHEYALYQKIAAGFFYILIMVVSFFGNSIVCEIFILTPAMRSTTNIYIANLSISDLLMTTLNMPLRLTQFWSKNWPLGYVLCKCMPFFQALSVNVSSFTMACIALDRFEVIAYPMKPRPGMTAIVLNIIFIWAMAASFSLPYSIIADLVEETTTEKIIHCKMGYPHPSMEFRKMMSLAMLFIQYIIPLSITFWCYCKICYILYKRKLIGMATESQIMRQRAAKWVTIRMLLVVFIVFAACWFPFNMYHTYQDLRGNVGFFKHNSTVVLTCHLIAMFSTCCNPFIYCWLNDSFRKMAKVKFNYIIRNIFCLRFFYMHPRYAPQLYEDDHVHNLKHFSSITKTLSCSTHSQTPSHVGSGTLAFRLHTDAENQTVPFEIFSCDTSLPNGNENKSSVSAYLLQADIEGSDSTADATSSSAKETCV
ncbi:G-protein coupled receptor 83-like [Uloborus diversus]|uniref:G-protein coupled receptor 83-like n=1 Tax=Uloborus diversus TaxID=327109 RepID=UPI002409753F|nr:G-protein coupled receptor 83-like [Uloborus diversus]